MPMQDAGKGCKELPVLSRVPSPELKYTPSGIVYRGNRKGIILFFVIPEAANAVELRIQHARHSRSKDCRPFIGRHRRQSLYVYGLI